MGQIRASYKFNKTQLLITTSTDSLALLGYTTG